MVLGLAAACLVAACSSGHQESSASCAGPQITVTPASAAPGGSVRVQGEYFMDGCADTVANGVPAPPAHALTGLSLMLTAGSGAARQLTAVDATGPLGAVDTTVTLPADLTPGPATLTLGTASPASLTITN